MIRLLSLRDRPLKPPFTKYGPPGRNLRDGSLAVKEHRESGMQGGAAPASGLVPPIFMNRGSQAIQNESGRCLSVRTMIVPFPGRLVVRRAMVKPRQG